MEEKIAYADWLKELYRIAVEEFGVVSDIWYNEEYLWHFYDEGFSPKSALLCSGFLR